MKNYELFEVINVCSEYLTDPENEEKAKALEEMKNSLSVRTYLPLRQKAIVWQKVLSDIEMADEELYTFSMAKEIAMMFDGLLAYVENINYNIDAVLKDEGIYDILVISGIYDYILMFCKSDYERLEKGVSDILSLRGVQHIAESFARINPDALDRLTDEFKKFTLETKPEVLKMYADISAFNDPVLANVKEGIEQSAAQTFYKETQKPE